MFGKKKAEEAAESDDKDKKKKKKTKAEKKEEKVSSKWSQVRQSDKPIKFQNFGQKKEPSLMKVLALNKPEWYYIIIGCIASVFSGAVQPAFSIIFSKATAVSFNSQIIISLIPSISF